MSVIDVTLVTRHQRCLPFIRPEQNGENPYLWLGQKRQNCDC